MQHAPILSLLACISVCSCTSIDASPAETLGNATLQSTSGSAAGSVDLLQDGSELKVSVTASGLAQGAHGFHLHTTGRCDAPDFKSAGGHLNPADNDHGTLSPGGSHLGDLPNLTVAANGVASATVVVSDDPARALDAIFDADGTAVIIHAEADDYRTNPSGDAGARVACGVLTRP